MNEVHGMLVTDSQKLRAARQKMPAERKAIRAAQAEEEAELDAFLSNLTSEQIAEMNHDCGE